jgi:hypothetical protein
MFILAILMVSACENGTASTVTLPLAEDRLTFLFFYTDG